MTEPAVATPFSLDIEHAGEKALVRCHGKLVFGLTDRLYSRVHPLIATSRHIVLDLSDLSMMDSMGLGAVVRLYVSAKSAGCCLELINIGQNIRRLLGVTHLLSVLTDMCEQGVSLRF
ncbi:MAG TPA: STAS domain-containing protein [Terracidiphilus sp.]|jgi:anti-sigma B factor antagonist|nr:STAS domain-containing protein [Terracidiphilus sp.]